MVIRYLDFVSVPIMPLEAYSPLIVDSDAVLTLAIAGEFLKAIARRDAKIVKSFCGVQYRQLVPCDTMQIRRKAS
jgi:hypothetical protein